MKDEESHLAIFPVAIFYINKAIYKLTYIFTLLPYFILKVLKQINFINLF